MNTSTINKNGLTTSASFFNSKPDKTHSEVNGGGFGEYLKKAVNSTNDAIVKAENIQNEFAAGKIDDIHRVLLEVEKADIAFQFTLQIRNKIMDAYNEIMRMQI